MTDKPASPFARLDTSLLRSTRDAAATRAQEPQPEQEQAKPTVPRTKAPRRANSRDESSARTRSSNQPDKIASKQASMLAPELDLDEELIRAIRKIVRLPGREVSFVRLTADEKAQLADIVYVYKRQGQKTSENEINRIAVNFILHDYHTNGKNSVLARVLEALLA